AGRRAAQLLLLALGPGEEALRAHYLGPRAHQRVAQAAGLGADDRIRPDLVRRTRKRGDGARHGVELLTEFGNPEGVGDVDRRDPELYRHVDRKLQRRRGEVVEGGVLEGPEKLLGRY